MAPGKKVGKDGGRLQLKKRCHYLAFTMLLVELLFHRFPVCDAENDRAKNWKGHIFSCLTWRDGNDTHAFWHSSIFASFSASCRRMPFLSEGIVL